MFKFSTDFSVFYSQLPKVPLALSEYPNEIWLPKTDAQARKLLKEVYECGVFNAIPIGRMAPGQFIVARICPGVEMAFGVVFKGHALGITLANAAKHFPLSLLTYADLEYHRISRSGIAAIEAFAMEWGAEKPDLESFWTALSKADEISNLVVRKAFLWKALYQASGATIYELLSACWQLEGPALAKWLPEKLIAPENSLIHTRAKLGLIPLAKRTSAHEEAMIAVLGGDDIFDATYSGQAAGLYLAAIENRESVRSINYFLNVSTVPDALAPIWPALSAFGTSPDNYDGMRHLSVAQEVALADPASAFVLASNGAALHARVRGKRLQEFVALLRQIADANGWDQLSGLLAWHSIV